MLLPYVSRAAAFPQARFGVPTVTLEPPAT